MRASMSPTSRKKRSAPAARSCLSLSAFREVEATSAPAALAIAAADRPMEVVPPQMRALLPRCSRSGRWSELYAVCSISGRPPTLAHGRPMRRSLHLIGGDDRVIGVSAIVVATHAANDRCDGAPNSSSPPGAKATVLTAFIPSTRGSCPPVDRPCLVKNPERLRPNASARISTRPRTESGSAGPRVRALPGHPAPTSPLHASFL